MPRVVTGHCEDGPLLLTEEVEFEPVGSTRPSIQLIFQHAAGPTGRGYGDLRVPWHRQLGSGSVVSNAGLGVHHTDAIDFDVVVAGSINLVLDDGVPKLQADDCLVITGADHA
jgi:hypothetical protein